MKQLKCAVTVFAMAWLTACGAMSTLKEPVPFATACTRLTDAIKGKCGDVTVDCAGLVACGAKTDQVEKVDLDVCTMNIAATTSCSGAQAVSCGIACTSK